MLNAGAQEYTTQSFFNYLSLTCLKSWCKALGTLWQVLKWLAMLILLRMRPECFECWLNAIRIF